LSPTLDEQAAQQIDEAVAVGLRGQAAKLYLGEKVNRLT